MSSHFEDLWEEGENSIDPETTIEEVISELEIKYSILKNIVSSGLKGEDRNQAVGLAMGSFLKSLSYLSMKENINVYAALKESLKS